LALSVSPPQTPPPPPPAPAARTALHEVSKTGEFVRTDAGFRNWIQEGGRFPPEAGRYHLVVSYACPWACRCLAAWALKGLQDVVSVSVVHPTWQRTRPDSEEDSHAGWVFRKPGDAPLASTTGGGSGWLLQRSRQGRVLMSTARQPGGGGSQPGGGGSQSGGGGRQPGGGGSQPGGGGSQPGGGGSQPGGGGSQT